MRRIPVLMLAAAATFSFGSAADAKGVLARDPGSVAKAMKDAGYPAVLSKDEAGDPLISSRTAGTDFSVNFYDCEEDNTNCSRVQFMLTVAEPRNGSLETLNAWNAENYFGRAYRNSTGGARLEMDVDLAKGGIAPDLFADHLQWWSTIMQSFEQLVRNDKPKDDDTQNHEAAETSAAKED